MNFKKLTPAIQQLTALTAMSALVLSLVFGAFPTAFAATVSSVTVDGNSTTTVSPSATVSVAVDLTVVSGETWKCTKYTLNSVNTLNDHADKTTSDSVVSNIIAPASVGTYSLTVTAYRNDTCTGGGNVLGTAFTLNNAIVVEVEEEEENTIPVIELIGDASVEVVVGATYEDEGATASDEEDGDLTDEIVITGLPVVTSVEGEFEVAYNVTDGDGGEAEEVIRTVVVVADEGPGNGGGNGGGGPSEFPQYPEDYVMCTWNNPQQEYNDHTVNNDSQFENIIEGSGYEVEDIVPSFEYLDEEGEAQTFDGHNWSGDYITIYDNGTCEGVVGVANTAPVITLTGSSSTTLAFGVAYVELGATVDDLEDGLNDVALPAENITGSVNSSVAATYTIYYNYTDTDSATATQVTRSVTVLPDSEGEGSTTTLTIIKLVTNGETPTSVDSESSDFELTVDDSSDTNQTVTGSVEGVTIEIEPGLYSVTEGEYSGYSADDVIFSEDCSGTIVEGEDLTCTVTNDQDRYVITGYVWRDRNSDGEDDGGNEAGVAGVTIMASNGTDEITTETDESGLYTLNVPQGTWTVSEADADWRVTEESFQYTIVAPRPEPEITLAPAGFFASIMNAIIPTAHAAIIDSFSQANFGVTPAGGGSGNGVSLSLSSSGSGSVAGASDSADDAPAGVVLGEATSALPAGAPNTGAGGAAASPVASLFALLGMLMSLVTLRISKNG